MASFTEGVALNVLDRDAILEGLEGDVELLEEIVHLFLEEFPRLLTTIGECVANTDAAGLRVAAHCLKGSLSNFGSPPAVALAFELETMGRNGDLTNAKTLHTSLVASLEQLKPALEGLVLRQNGDLP
jgi:HPt (histidine-containing phosphotransfer) domain-containing protein